MTAATDGKTNIEVFLDTWSRLKDRKERPGDSFDDVINRALDEIEDDADEEAENRTNEADAQEQVPEDPIEEILDEWGPTWYGSPDETKQEVGRAALELLRDRGEANRGLIRSLKGSELPNADVTQDTYWQSYVRVAYVHGCKLGYIELEEDRRPQRYIWVGR